MIETLNVQGMGCGKCAEAIETNVGALAGVSSVQVNLDQANVTIDVEDAKVMDQVKVTIEEQGYEVA